MILLIPILATCFIDTEVDLSKNFINKPKIGYIYAITDKYVYVDFSGPIRENTKIDLDKLTKIEETRCKPIINKEGVK
jgi:hypothetical protein